MATHDRDTASRPFLLETIQHARLAIAFVHTSLSDARQKHEARLAAHPGVYVECDKGQRLKSGPFVTGSRQAPTPNAAGFAQKGADDTGQNRQISVKKDMRLLRRNATCGVTHNRVLTLLLDVICCPLAYMQMARV